MIKLHNHWHRGIETEITLPNHRLYPSNEGYRVASRATAGSAGGSWVDISDATDIDDALDILYAAEMRFQGERACSPEQARDAVHALWEESSAAWSELLAAGVVEPVEALHITP